MTAKKITQKEVIEPLIFEWTIEKTQYDLNWYLIRKKIINFHQLLRTLSKKRPKLIKNIWLRYENWFNAVVNRGK